LGDVAGTREASGEIRMKIKTALAAAASCAVLAFFAGAADAQKKLPLDANGMPCDGVLDGALQCFKKDATVNTLEHPYRTAGESDGRRYGPGRGFTLGEKELIYAAVPGSIVVLDAKNNYTFVKRIVFETQPATLPLESIAGMAASTATNMVYVSTRGHLYAIDLLTEKVVWKNAYEPGTCCERGQVTPDGLTMEVGSDLKNFHRVIDLRTGAVKGIIPTPQSMFNHNMNMTPDGKTTFDAANGNTMTIADMATMKPTGTITFSDHVRVFVINHDGSRVYANLNNLLGFEIADVKTRKVIKRIEAPAEMWKAKWADPNQHFYGHGAPMHGIAMTPDESEIWIPDAINNQVLVYDNTGEWPKLDLSKSIKTEAPNGWITMGLDGKLAYMASGDVVDVKSHKIVGLLRDEYGRHMDSEKVLDLAFNLQGKMVRKVNEFAIGDPEAYAKRMATQKRVKEASK
jgi:DNA-binding beta-propeller fold protein YncE